MSIGIRVPGFGPAPQVVEFLGEVEDAGFDWAGIPDTQFLMRDPYTVIALALQRLDHLGLMTAVTNPITRDVSVLAGVGMSVYECGPGRFGIIIGSGASSVEPLGRPPATTAEMRHAIRTLKALFRGQRVDFPGGTRKLEFLPEEPPKIVMAATGPRMMEVAGEVADGLLLQAGLHENIIKEALRCLEIGAQRGGRCVSDIEIVLSVRSVIRSDLSEARRLTRPECAQWAVLPNKARWLHIAGVDIPRFDEMPPKLAALYPDIIHAVDTEAAIDATDFLSDDQVAEICDALGVIGTPESCARKLHDVSSRLGASLFLKGMEAYGPPRDLVRAFRDAVSPALTELRR